MMRKTLRIIIFFIAAGVCSPVFTAWIAAAPPPFEARLISSTLKIFPDEIPPGEPRAPLEMIAVRNEYAPFQVAVTATEDISALSVSLSDLIGGKRSIPASNAQLYLVENVTIEKPSIAAVRKVWPDPLPPYRNFNVAAGTTRAVWVDLFVPADTLPGTYKGAVSISVLKSATTTIPVILDVKDITISDQPHLKTAFGIGYGDIMNAHHVAQNSPEEQALKDAYYWFLVKHRLSPYYLPVDFFSDEAHRYLDDPRVTFLRAPFSWDKDEMQKIADRLKITGWIKKAVFYLVDEPEPDQFPKINKIGQWLHSFDPDLQLLITTGHTPALKEADIKIWCPVLTFTLDMNVMRRLHKDMERGKEFWWYTCIGPKWEGTDYFIDEGATSPRVHPWMNYLYGVTGILYWQTTHWSQVNYNPWEKTETYPNGNGDGHLIYPGYQVGYNGPIASIRLKMLREGMEDYELLYLLGETLKQVAGRIGGAALEYDPRDRLFEHAFALILPKGRSSPLGRNTPYLMFVTRDYKDIESERERVIGEITQAFSPPLVLVTTDPVENGYTKKKSAVVKGCIEQGSQVTVNGEPARVDGKTFRAEVSLRTGGNIISVTVSRDGRSKTIQRTVFRK